MCQEITHHTITVHYITHYTITSKSITPESGSTLSMLQHECEISVLVWMKVNFPHCSVIQVCWTGAHSRQGEGVGAAPCGCSLIHRSTAVCGERDILLHNRAAQSCYILAISFNKLGHSPVTCCWMECVCLLEGSWFWGQAIMFIVSNSGGGSIQVIYLNKSGNITVEKILTEVWATKCT